MGSCRMPLATGLLSQEIRYSCPSPLARDGHGMSPSCRGKTPYDHPMDSCSRASQSLNYSLLGKSKAAHTAGGAFQSQRSAGESTTTLLCMDKYRI